MTTESKTENPVFISVMSIYNKKQLSTLLYSFEQLVKIAKDASYDGLEWHPNRLPSGGQLEYGNVDVKALSCIKSLHQNWTGEKSIFDVLRNLKHGPLKLSYSAFSYLFLPERVSSLDNLVRIQKRVGKPLPVVLYPPENDQERSGTDLPFAEVTFQPTPEIMRKWQVSSVDGLLTQAKIRGYIKHSDEERKPALGYDLLHARALGEVSLNPWQETLPELLPFITELHIPVNRDDVKAPHLDIEGESRDLEEGTTKSELSQILDMFRDYGWRGRVVIEAAPVNKPIDQWVVYHQKIATNIRQRLN